MRKTSIASILTISMFASCGTNIDGVRLSGGESLLRVLGDEPGAKSSASDRDQFRAEIVNRTARNTEVGLLLGYNQGNVYGGSVEAENYDLGMVARGFLNAEGFLQPYGEFRLGYRRAELFDAEFVDVASQDMILAGVGVGLQLQATSSLAIFAQANYDCAFGPDYDSYGPSFMVGASVTF